MTGYQIVIDDIAAAGRAAQRVASVLGSLGFAGAVPAGEAGMPGARAVAKLAAVKDGWARQENSLARGFTDYANDLARAAEFYRAHEDAAQRELRQFEMPSGMN